MTEFKPVTCWNLPGGRTDRPVRKKVEAKPPEATTKPYTRHILGIDSGLQSHNNATPKPPQSHTKATSTPPLWQGPAWEGWGLPDKPAIPFGWPRPGGLPAFDFRNLSGLRNIWSVRMKQNPHPAATLAAAMLAAAASLLQPSHAEEGVRPEVGPRESSGTSSMRLTARPHRRLA